jgi:hypothetical protein
MPSLIGSKRTATLITWLVLLVFCSLILIGWWYLLKPTVGVKGAVGAAALLLTAIAAISARQIGQLRADAIKESAPPKWYRGWKPYLFLAVVSALGTLNAAFVLFESRAILRNDLANVRDSYGVLRDAAHRELPIKSHLEKVANVEALLKNLHEEIVNPSGGKYCGVGSSAKTIIDKMKSYLPNYQILRGSDIGHDCNDPRVKDTYQSYEQIAREMLQSDPDYLAANGPAKAALLATIDAHYDEMRTSLGRLEASATGVGATDGLDIESLYAARDNYNADRSSLLSVTGAPSSGVESIDVLQSDRVNSYAATLRLFLARMNHPSSWGYLALAFGLDFAVIYLLTQFNVQYGRRKDLASPALAEPRDERFQTDPRFLWVKPNRPQPESEDARR